MTLMRCFPADRRAGVEGIPGIVGQVDAAGFGGIKDRSGQEAVSHEPFIGEICAAVVVGKFHCQGAHDREAGVVGLVGEAVIVGDEAVAEVEGFANGGFGVGAEEPGEMRDGVVDGMGAHDGEEDAGLHPAGEEKGGCIAGEAADVASAVGHAGEAPIEEVGWGSCQFGPGCADVAGPGGDAESLGAGGEGAVDRPEAGIAADLRQGVGFGLVPAVILGVGDFAFIVPPAVDSLLEEAGHLLGIPGANGGVAEIQAAGVDAVLRIFPEPGSSLWIVPSPGGRNCPGAACGCRRSECRGISCRRSVAAGSGKSLG